MRENSKRAALPNPLQAALQQVYIIVVTYNPNLEILRRQFARLNEEGIRAVIVDNNSSNRDHISTLALEYSLDFTALAENIGVAAAHNRGIDYIRSRGGKYLVFLDQDSVPEKEAFTVLTRTYLTLAQGVKVGAVGSSYTLQAGQQGSSFVRFGWFHFNKIYCQRDAVDSHEVDFLISSGTFIPVAVIDDVGPMREKLFIDHVDTDWFLRARSRSYRFYGCCAAKMSHALGERTVRVWLGRWRNVPVHKGFRYFYTFRNSLWLYRQSYAPAKWISADAMRLIYIFLFSGLLVQSRRENITWMYRGLKAGLRDMESWTPKPTAQSGE